MNKKDFLKAMDTLPKVEFENEHGENFVLRRSPMEVIMSGDEVNAMVKPTSTVHGHISIFNSEFSTWSDDELKKLGYALIELAQENEKYLNSLRHEDNDE